VTQHLSKILHLTNYLQLFLQTDTLNIVKRLIKKARGFTLVELLIYMGLLTVLVGVLSMVFASIIDVQLRSESNSSVDQDGRYILSRMLYDVKGASSITTPANAGNTSSTLQMLVNNITYTYSLDGSGNLQLTNNNGINALNGYDTQVSGLNFQRLGAGDSNDTIRMTFTITSRTSPHNQAETKTYQTTLSRDYAK
jgi:type II secretory pathway pseudopilin PulG